MPIKVKKEDVAKNTEEKKSAKKAVAEKEINKKKTAKPSGKSLDNETTEQTDNATADVKKEPKAKKEKASKEPKERKSRGGAFIDRLVFAANLILERKYTDKQIIEKTSAKFPDYPIPFTQKEMGRIRWMAGNNKFSAFPDSSENMSNFSALVEYNGKLIPKSERPKVPKNKREKVTEENDPLNKVGINVHKAKKEKAEEPAKKSPVKKSPVKKEKIDDQNEQGSDSTEENTEE